MRYTPHNAVGLLIVLRAERPGDRFSERGHEMFTLSENPGPLWDPNTLLLNGQFGFFHFGYNGRKVNLVTLLPVDPT